MKAGPIPESVIQHVASAPPDLLGIGDAEGERAYLGNAMPSYQRTVADVEAALGGRKGRLLEIGSFLGVVAFALKARGHEVTATDLPEFAGRESNRAYYHGFGVELVPVNLRHRRLPFPDAAFDGVVMCETLEHLNFNPLPVLLEVNRVLKPRGFLYLAMPNAMHLARRLRFLFGRSIHPPIEEFFLQLNPKENSIVGLHWREYSVAETREMLERMGFEIRSSRLVTDHLPPGRLLRTLFRIASLLPAARTTQVVVAEKRSCPDHRFNYVEANS